MNTLQELVEQIDYELNHNPAPVGDGGLDDTGLASLLAEALPHLQRYASLTLIYHPESDCYFWAKEFSGADGLSMDVTGEEKHEARAFGEDDVDDLI